jgi:hypothetical protein
MEQMNLLNNVIETFNEFSQTSKINFVEEDGLIAPEYRALVVQIFVKEIVSGIVLPDSLKSNGVRRYPMHPFVGIIIASGIPDYKPGYLAFIANEPEVGEILFIRKTKYLNLHNSKILGVISNPVKFISDNFDNFDWS